MDIISKAIISTLNLDMPTPDQQEAISQNYQALKAMLIEKYGADSDLLDAVEKLEQKPISSARRAMLGEEIITYRLNADSDLRNLARDLVELIQPTPPPPLRTFNQPPPIQRPPKPANFVNRETELMQLLPMLQPGKAVALCGPVGVGKSALAAAAVWQLTPQGKPPEQFPDGVIYYNFHRQARADIALEEIGRVFNEDPIPSPYDGAERAMAQRKALIVLDGADKADDLSGILALQGTSGMLLTGEKCPPAVTEQLNLSPLALDRAMNLLQAWGVKTESDTAQQICDLLGRIPLAIRLASGFLADEKHDSRTFLNWLKNSTQMSKLTPPERQEKAIALVLAHSLAQVSEVARSSLAVASLLALAPFNPELVVKTMAMEPNQGLFSSIRGLFGRNKPRTSGPLVMQGLRELGNYGLMESNADGYSITHPAVYRYAKENLKPPPRAVRRLATLFMAMAWEHGGQHPAGINPLDINRHHFMKVMDECIQLEEWDAAHGLAAAVEDYLDRNGYLGDRVLANEIGLIAAWKLGRPSEGAWLGNLGDTYRTMGHAKWAIEHFEKALQTARQSGDKPGEGNSLGNLGLAYRDLGQIEQAVQYLKHAEAIFEEIRSPSAGLVKDWLTELEYWDEE